MKRNLIILAFAWGVGMAVRAADSPSGTATPPTTNTTTIMASFVLSPGRYASSLSPNINRGMAERIEKSLARIPGVNKVTAVQEDSTIHFNISAGSHVLISDIQREAAAADHGVVISVPVLENSQTAQLGT